MSKNQELKQNDVPKKKKFLSIDTKFEIIRTFVAIGISLGIVLIIVALVSDKPLEAIQALLLGPLTSARRFGNVIELMIPLTFTGLAVTVILKTNRFNLSSEGAFYLGGIVATWIAIFSPFSTGITILMIIFATMICGAIVGFIPAIINKKFYANELVTALMMNYIVAFLVKYILNNKVRDASKSVVQSLPIPKSLSLPIIIPGTRIHIGFLIMLGLVIVTWLVIYKTKWGYALRATGSNEKFAVYSGIKVSTVVILAQMIGTALAGLGGGIEILGLYTSFQWIETPGYGFDGVIISTLARGNPAMVPLAAFFLSYVRVGADILNRTSDIPAEIVSIVQATIILLIAAKAFLAKRKHKMVVKEAGVFEQSTEVTQ